MKKTVEECDDARWNQMIEEEGRPLNVVLHHIVAVCPPVVDWAVNLGNDDEVPQVTIEQVHTFNKAHADQHAAVSKAQVLEDIQTIDSKSAAQLRA